VRANGVLIPVESCSGYADAVRYAVGLCELSGRNHVAGRLREIVALLEEADQ